MKLLNQTRTSELPTDALLARLRCRRAAIDPVAGQSTEAPAVDVVYWVYQRLNRRLRKRLEPFLDLLAMRNLTLILRYSLAGEPPAAMLINNSLLNETLHRLVTTTEDAKMFVAQLEAALVSDYPFVTGLAATYYSQGPGGVERQLVDGILQHGLARSSNKVISTTLRYLVDMRNCLLINKLWRWQVSRMPPLTDGGQLSISSLQRVWATNDRNRLTMLTVQLAGKPLPSEVSTGMEQCLLSGLTKLLKRAGRDPLGLAVIIEYLWVAQLAIHNQFLRQALAVDREELLEEVLLL